MNKPPAETRGVSERSIGSAADFWCALARYVGGHFGNVAGHWLNVFALCVITFSALFSRSAMRLGRILVMFGGLIMCIFRHWILRLKYLCDLLASDALDPVPMGLPGLLLGIG